MCIGIVSHIPITKFVRHELTLFHDTSHTNTLISRVIRNCECIILYSIPIFFILFPTLWCVPQATTFCLSMIYTYDLQSDNNVIRIANSDDGHWNSAQHSAAPHWLGRSPAARRVPDLPPCLHRASSPSAVHRSARAPADSAEPVHQLVNGCSELKHGLISFQVHS